MPLFRKSASNPAHQSSIFRSLHEDLRQAAWNGDLDTVVKLIKKGAKFVPNKEGRTALHAAAMKGHLDVVRVLIEHGCDLNSQDKLGYTAVHRAVLEGHSEIVRTIVDTNVVNLDKQDFVQENTPLHDASWHGFTTIVESLLSAKSNVYVRNKTGATALHLACQNGHCRSARLLIQHGCRPDVKDKYDDTPLHTSCRYIHAGVTRVLLAASASPNEQNKNGDTPLHLACNLGQKKISRMLLDSGGKADIKNKQGETPIDIAIRKQLADLVEVLKASTKHSSKASCENVVSAGTTSRPSRSKIRERLQAAKDAGSTWQLLFQDWTPYGLDNRTINNSHQRTHPRLYPMESGFTSPPVTPPKTIEDNGEQYCVDLAGNLRKAPIACYCAPFFYHLAKHNNDAHLELLEEIDACQNNLSNEISDLRQVTSRRIDDLNRAVKWRQAAGKEQRQRQGWHRLLSTTKRRLYCTAVTTPNTDQQPTLPPAGRLVRSKSESEIETDIERGRTNAIADQLDDSDSASNASDDAYYDRRYLRRNICRGRNNNCGTISRTISKAASPPITGDSSSATTQLIRTNALASARNISPFISTSVQEREKEGLLVGHAVTLEETVQQFNKLESDSCQDSSSAGGATTMGSCSGMSSRCTPDTSVRSSIYSSQSGCSCLSASQLSNSKSHQPSLDSGYGSTSVKAEHELDVSSFPLLHPSELAALGTCAIQQSDHPIMPSNLNMKVPDHPIPPIPRPSKLVSCKMSSRVEAETQTDSSTFLNKKQVILSNITDSHEYTELECMLRSSTSSNFGGSNRHAKPPPILPIPPPPRKPLPPLPIDTIDSSPPKRSVHRRSTRYNPTNACLCTNV